MADEAVPTSDVSSQESTSSSGYDAMMQDLAGLDAADTPTEEAESAPALAPEPIAEEETPEPEAETDDPTPPPVEPEAEDKADVPVAEELPEGVTVRDKNGKKEYTLREARYHSIYNAYKAAQSAEQVFGEELTPELAQSRQNAYISQEAMLADYLSGDPSSEGRFLNQLAHWSKQAQELGEVKHSPLRSIAEKLPQFLQQIGDVETLNSMAQPVFRQRLDQLYSEAQKSGNENLFLSLQHIDHALFGTYRKPDQVSTAAAELSEREAKLVERERKIQESDTRTRQADLKRWQDDTGTVIKTTVADAVVESLKPVLPFYEKFPHDLQGLKSGLLSEFQETLRKDMAWQTYLETAGRRAANAASPEVRQAVAEDLKARYTAKAKYFFDSNRNSKVREILSQRAAAMRAQSDAKHARLATAATRREPGSIGTPVAPTVVKKPNGTSTNEQWAEAVAEALR